MRIPTRSIAAALALAGGLALAGCQATLHPHAALVSPDVPSFAELVVIRRDERARGYVRVRVMLDAQPLVSLRTGQYTLLRVRPGYYNEIYVDGSGQQYAGARMSWAAGARRLQLDAGRRYYVLVKSLGPAAAGGETAFGTGLLGEAQAKPLLAQYEEVRFD